MSYFRDRHHAGTALARAVGDVVGPDTEGVVLGLARGGLPVAVPVAASLHWPVAPYIVRKLGVPRHPELAFGAVASGGATVLNTAIIDHFSLPERVIREVIDREVAEVDRRTRLYRGTRPAPSIEGRTVVVVDDGAATGASVRVAVASIRLADPERVVVALPVASAEAVQLLRAEADAVVALHTPEPFMAVGTWYERFDQVPDDEVIALLDAAGQ